MLGKYIINIRNNKVSYEIPLDRKITVIKGESGTGKTTFVKMVRDWLDIGRKSGIHCSCGAELDILEHRTDWRTKLSEVKGKIFIADENLEYLTYQDFGEAVNQSENYFLFITRSGRLGNMTYAISSILALETRKEGTINFTSAYSRYVNKNRNMLDPDIIITEDSNLGYEMMGLLYRNIRVVPGCGKDNMYNIFSQHRHKRVILFVDGAAFGSCIGRYNSVLKQVVLIAPESFEYLLLNTEALKKFVENELANTADYCDFKGDIISYERYFTELLKDTLLINYNVHYTKSHLVPFFKNEMIYQQLREFLFEIKC